MAPKLTLVGFPDDEPTNPFSPVNPSSIRIPIAPRDTRSPHAVAKAVQGLRRPSLTAASKKIDMNNPNGSPFHARSNQQVSWQQEAWAIYDQVGELRFASNLYANGLSRIRLELCRDDGTGEKATRLRDLKPEELTDLDKTVQGIIDDFTTDQPLDEMQRLWGLNKFVVGEAMMVGIPMRGRKGRRRKMLDYSWKIYSKEDVQNRNGVLWVAGEQYDPDEVLVIRIWQPHPRRSWEADSPVRATLPILRELIGLTMHVSAIIDSRLAGAGILLLPTSATVLGGTAPEDDQEEDPTVAAIIENMITPIKDRDSAASVVPLIMVAPDESVDAIRHISFASPLDSAAKDLRDEAIRRLALGLDMPPEQLLGLATGSHWTAWLVAEDTVRYQFVPGIKPFAEALMQELIYPILLEMGVSEEDAYIYRFDAVADELISRPNHFDEALEIYKVDGLTLPALLKAGGFDITDMPEKQQDFDRAVDLALKAVAINPSLFSDPGLPNLVSQLRAVLDGKDASNAPPEATPQSQQSSDAGATGPMETNTTDPDRPNQQGPAKSSPKGPDKA